MDINTVMQTSRVRKSFSHGLFYTRVLKSEVNSTLINGDEQLLNQINQTYIKVSGKSYVWSYCDSCSQKIKWDRRILKGKRRSFEIRYDYLFLIISIIQLYKKLYVLKRSFKWSIRFSMLFTHHLSQTTIIDFCAELFKRAIVLLFWKANVISCKEVLN